LKLHIKNMVCDRCKLVIENILNELNIPFLTITLGTVDFGEIRLTDLQLEALQEKLEPIGFEILRNKRSKTIESIRTAIIKLVNLDNISNKQNLSDYIASEINRDYKYLSNLFSSVEGITIEQYLINQKIEKAKELIVYDELSLTEISYKLGYSSLAHLSNQFKKVTGLTPSHFKELKSQKTRKPLDKV